MLAFCEFSFGPDVLAFCEFSFGPDIIYITDRPGVHDQQPERPLVHVRWALLVPESLVRYLLRVVLCSFS